MFEYKLNSVKMLNASVLNLAGSTICSICRENLNNNSISATDKNMESSVEIGICNHSFHEECINPWIKINNKCPTCSTPWCKLTVLTNKKNCNKCNKSFYSCICNNLFDTDENINKKEIKLKKKTINTYAVTDGIIISYNESSDDDLPLLEPVTIIINSQDNSNNLNNSTISSIVNTNNSNVSVINTISGSITTEGVNSTEDGITTEGDISVINFDININESFDESIDQT